MPAFNELNRALNARISANREEHGEVVRHHREIVQFELAGQSVGPKHVNKKLGFVFRAKKRTVHVGLTPGKKHPPARDDITPVGLSRELYHRQQLKPGFYYGPYRPAEARALIRTRFKSASPRFCAPSRRTWAAHSAGT